MTETGMTVELSKIEQVDPRSVSDGLDEESA